METNESPCNAARNINIFFAFAHGIRLTLEAHGYKLDNPEAISPILDRMYRILQTPQASLIAFRDDEEASFELFKHLRELESALCMEYLDKVIARNL